MFKPTECDIDKGVLETLKTEFQNLHDRICGRSEGYGDVATTTGDTFSDLIASPLKSTARENTESWSSSMMACTVAIGSLSETIEAVDWYEEKIEDIRIRYQAKVSSSSNAEDVDALTALANPFNTEATNAWSTLEQKCQDAGDTLANGADPDNIRKLIEAGHISADIAFATTGDWDHFYFDPDDAETMMEDIQELLENDGSGSWSVLLGTGGHLAVLGELVQRALNAQNSGGTLNSNEIEFLENLFGDFEGEYGDGNFIDFLTRLENSETLNDPMRKDLSELLSGAMLAASDESIGGAYENIPPDVREIIEGPNEFGINGDGMLFSDWVDPFQVFSNFIGHADDGMQGGMEFSAELTATISRTINVDSDGMLAGPIDESVFTTVLDIATRNEDANYALITGQYPEDSDGNYQLSERNSEVDLESIMFEFYSRQWEDGGEAAAGLTDWIFDYSMDPDSEEHEDRMSTHAAYEIITELTSEPLESKLRNTGIATEGGNQNASFTELNPNISATMNNIYLAHINDFSLQLPPGDSKEERWGPIDSNTLSHNPLHESDDYTMFLGDTTKTDFLQFLLANEETAPTVLAASHAHELEYVNTALTGDVRSTEDDFSGWNSNSLGSQAGEFNNMLNQAMANEYMSRGDGQEEAREKYVNNWMTAYEIVNTVSSEAVGSDISPLGAANDIIFELGKDPVQEHLKGRAEEKFSDDFLDQKPDDWVPNNKNDLERNVLLQAINVGASEGYIDPGDIPRAFTVEGEDGKRRIAQDISEWAGSISNVAAMDEVIGLMEIENAAEIIDEYSRGYSGEHDSAADLFRNSGEWNDAKKDFEENKEN